MLVLGIETSCDETAASVVLDGSRALADVVVSQVDAHKAFGGVAPEVASRKHIEALSFVLDEAVSRAGVTFNDIEGIGVTRGPGLIGSLLVGISAAKGIALALKRPLCGVNHLHGHIFASFLSDQPPTYPFIALVVSGGHTSLFDVRGPFDLEVVGRTRDDAAGEAFDKVGKLLGLGYPGGPIIEERARRAGPTHLRFPRALMEGDQLDFSFSGLKTAVLRHAEEAFDAAADRKAPGSFHPLIVEGASEQYADRVNAIAAAFQEAVIDVLIEKTLRAAAIKERSLVAVCGGVACNRALRQRMCGEASKKGVCVMFPPPELCADNGAMIAARADTLLSNGMFDALTFDARSRW
jgi:N6-L-threonylcarbamoyladenine synthase